LRATDDPIETLGIDRRGRPSRRRTTHSVLVDAAAGEVSPKKKGRSSPNLPAALPRLVIHNKIDLAGVAATVRTSWPQGGAGDSPTPRHVYLSAKTGEGIELLRGEILALAGAHEDMEDTFLARERHLDALACRGEAQSIRRCNTFACAQAAARARRGGPAGGAHGACRRSRASSPPTTFSESSSRGSASANDALGCAASVDERTRL
jgi:tRNA U34 5-carboxymethylaminomethyl modifying GTPase MnmE/TrmE